MTGALIKTLYLSKSNLETSVNVIDTDYSSYAITHECRLDYGFLKTQGMSILSRQAHPIDSKAHLNFQDKICKIIDQMELGNYPNLGDLLISVVQGKDLCEYEIQLR